MSATVSVSVLNPPSFARSLDVVSLLPQQVSATDAIARLRHVRLLSARQALERLDVWRDSTRLLILYQHFFPAEYARSTASLLIPDPQEGQTWMLSPREIEFCRMVAQDLFPLPDFLLEEGERLDFIPVTCQGIEWEEIDMEAEYWQPSIRAAVALTIEEDEFDWQPWLADDLRPRAGQRDWKAFVHACRAVGEERAFFPLLVSMIAHDTGNVWLDVYEESWERFEWTVNNIVYLTHQWQAAKRMLAKINRLMDVMERDLRSWLTELVTLWNRALIAEPPRSAPTIRTITAEEFVRGDYFRGQPLALA